MSVLMTQLAIAMLIELDKLRRSDLAKISELDRAYTAVLRVYDYIWKTPIIEVRNISPIFGMSYNTIAKAVKILADISVLEQTDEQKRYRRYGYKKALDAFQAF